VKIILSLSLSLLLRTSLKGIKGLKGLMPFTMLYKFNVLDVSMGRCRKCRGVWSP